MELHNADVMMRDFLKLSAHLLIEFCLDYAAKTNGFLEVVDNHTQLKRTHSFFYNVKLGSQEKDGVIFLYVQLKALSVKLETLLNSSGIFLSPKDALFILI